MAHVSYGRTLTELAEADPHHIILACEEDEIDRAGLEFRANQLARVYRDLGVTSGDIVSLCLPNGIELVAAMFATWKLGAIPNPLSERLPEAELSAILERAEPRLVVGEVGARAATRRAARYLPTGFTPDADVPGSALPDVAPSHERALASGGSTGLPKLIIPMAQALYDPDNPSQIFRPTRTGLVPGPLYHAAPFSGCFQAILAGSKAVLMRRFEPRRFLELIERHRVDRVTLVPTMMQRVWKLPAQERERFDVSSLEFVLSGGAPMPAWLMQAWIDWLGPDVMHEAFGPSERIGGTFITGREWLAHPGSVGRPSAESEIRILDDAGQVLPAGEMGEIYMRPRSGPGSTYKYIGASSERTEDGWETVGDMGYLDADGYLFLGDRRADMILCGGRNLYPAEIEAALDAHEAVASSAVIGLPDDDLGQRVHAIVQTARTVEVAELKAHLRDRLVGYKVPHQFEFVETPLRDDAGKVRRSRLRAERMQT